MGESGETRLVLSLRRGGSRCEFAEAPCSSRRRAARALGAPDRSPRAQLSRQALTWAPAPSSAAGLPLTASQRVAERRASAWAATSILVSSESAGRPTLTAARPAGSCRQCAEGGCDSRARRAQECAFCSSSFAELAGRERSCAQEPSRRLSAPQTNIIRRARPLRRRGGGSAPLTGVDGAAANSHARGGLARRPRALYTP